MRTWETPSTRATPLRTRSRSSFGTRSARLRATAPASLHLELREGAGVVPLRGEDSLVLVVPRETADSGLDELEAALVREVLGVRLHVALEVDGPPHEGAEVLRELPREPLSGEDLRDGLAGREPDVRDRVQVPESGADRRLRVALPVELHDDLRDLVRLERDPLRVFRDERAGRAVLALPLRVDSRHESVAIPRVGINGLRGGRPTSRRTLSRKTLGGGRCETLDGSGGLRSVRGSRDHGGGGPPLHPVRGDHLGGRLRDAGP